MATGFNILKTPRFYTSLGMWYHLKGRQNFQTDEFATIALDGVNPATLINMDPYKAVTLKCNGSSNPLVFVFRTGVYSEAADRFRLNYFAILGHNLKDSGAQISISCQNQNGSSTEALGLTPILNAQVSGNVIKGYQTSEEANGTAIVELSEISSDLGQYIRIEIQPQGDTFTDDVVIGSFAWGKYYDMQHAPDLNLTLDYNYEGVTKTRNDLSGKDFVNVNYDQGPKFAGKYVPFGRSTDIKYSGRRTWSLTFTALRDSYPDDSEYDNTDKPYLFAENIHHNYDHIIGNSFQMMVMDKTMGGAIPFLFEIDITDTASDQTHIAVLVKDGEHFEGNFMFARFKSNSFTFQQTYHRLWTTSLQIEEAF